VSVAWYTLAYLPALRQITDIQRRLTDEIATAKKLKDDEDKARQLALQLQTAERGTFTVDSNPTGATVTIGDFRRTTPAHFTDIIPGTFTLVIHADGYEDY